VHQALQPFFGGAHCSFKDLNITSQTKGRISGFLGSAKAF
jgi:hypothetical protein